MNFPYYIWNGISPISKIKVLDSLTSTFIPLNTSELNKIISKDSIQLIFPLSNYQITSNLEIKGPVSVLKVLRSIQCFNQQEVPKRFWDIYINELNKYQLWLKDSMRERRFVITI